MGTAIRCLVLVSCIAIVCSLPRAAVAAMTIDLRAVRTSSGTVLDEKHVLFSGGAGDTVQADVWATVTGSNSNPHDDIINWLHGSYLSSFGGLGGNLQSFLVDPYNGALSGSGFRRDLDGDGDLDVGSNDDTSPTGFFRAYFRGDFEPQATALVGIVVWTYTGGSGQTSLNFRPRIDDDGAGWAEDGIGLSPLTGNFLAGVPVQLSFVPEPSGPFMLVITLATIFHGRSRARS